MQITARTGFGRVLFSLRPTGILVGLIGIVALLSGCAGSISRDTYMKITDTLQLTGELRTDRAPADAPFDATDVAQSFQSIAFSYEFQFRGGKIVPRRLERPLKRWQGTIRYRTIGDGVTAADRAEIAALLEEVADLTGLSFQASSGAHDLLISIATAKGEDDVAAFLEAQGKARYRHRYESWRKTPHWLCGATLSNAGRDKNRLAYAHVFLSDATKGTLRRACLHEEIVQSLGLTDDSPRARPSIFNDDQEFALLTEHDAILLSILYDPALSPGMRAAEAMPIVQRLARKRMHARRVALAPGQPRR